MLQFGSFVTFSSFVSSINIKILATFDELTAEITVNRM